MNRLVIIGNGFDMAHGLKTSYMDFINWYWDQRVNSLLTNNTDTSEDCLCSLVIKNKEGLSSWHLFSFQNSFFYKDIYHKERYSGFEIIQEILKHPEVFSIKYCPLFENILQSIETKGWVDIENDYYQLLKDCATNVDSNETVSELNM